MDLRKIVSSALAGQGFQIVSEGPSGIFARRKVTGKLIGVVWPYSVDDPLKLWTRFRVHPFMAHMEGRQLLFRDLLNLEDFKII